MRKLLFALFVLVAQSAWAQITSGNVYVDTDLGNNGNACTAAGASACATLAGALGKIGTLTGAAVVHCKGTVADSSTTDTLAIAGKSTTATNTLTIQADSGDRHSGVFTTSKYRLARNFVGASEPGISISDPYVTIDWIQVQYSSDTAGNKGAIYVIPGVAATVNISHNLIVRGAQAVAGMGIYTNGATQVVKAWNNIISGGFTYSGIYNISSTLYAYNNTIVGNTRGMERDSGTLVAKANIVHGSGNTNSYVGTFGTGTDYNSTDSTDSIGVGSNNRTSQTITFVDSGSSNYLLASNDAGARDVGVDLSGDANIAVTDDVIGTLRPVGSVADIGASEAAAAGAALPPGRGTRRGVGE